VGMWVWVCVCGYVCVWVWVGVGVEGVGGLKDYDIISNNSFSCHC